MGSTRYAPQLLPSETGAKLTECLQVIPHSILEKAAGFAIFTVVKAGFLFSARAGSGIVIARTHDGCELLLRFWGRPRVESRC